MRRTLNSSKAGKELNEFHRDAGISRYCQRLQLFEEEWVFRAIWYQVKWEPSHSL
jgi:hypothetical protein